MEHMGCTQTVYSAFLVTFERIYLLVLGLPASTLYFVFLNPFVSYLTLIFNA